MRRTLAVGIFAAVALTACGGQTAAPGTTPTTDAPSADVSTDRTFDTSAVQKVDEIAGLVPTAVAERGTLLIGASADYAPAEFRADDLKTYIGYDVDLGRALGKVLGLEAEVQDAEFASILPAIGTKFNVGISSFTIRPDRIEQANMIAYITAGSSYAVKKGNPEGLTSIADLCGLTVAVQRGTTQADYAQTQSDQCVADGDSAIELLQFDRETEAMLQVKNGRAASGLQDYPVAAYNARESGGGEDFEVVGEQIEAGPLGIGVGKQNTELRDALQQALQAIIDDGSYQELIDDYQTPLGAIESATINGGS